MDKIVRIKLKLLDSRAIVPVQRDGDSGSDLHALQDQTISEGKIERVGFGLALEIPPGFTGFVLARSGLSLSGNTAIIGTIDQSYRGEISALARVERGQWRIRAGDRIAQLVIVPCPRVWFDPCDSLSETERGNAGFGSTGISSTRLREPGNSG